MSRRLGVAASLVDGAVVPGDVEVADGRIRAVGVAGGGTGLACPGYIDLQVNGFAGWDFTDITEDGYAEVGAALAASGVTAFQPTLITLPAEDYRRPLEVAAALQPAMRPRLLGVHLEGPFLSPAKRGAHDERHMLTPDWNLLSELMQAGPVTHVTIAPDLPGAVELIGLLVEHGLTVSVGHSPADTAQAVDAFDAGAIAVTHLFNAMAPLDHRDPGIAGVALTRPGVVVTLIVDGYHLADEMVRLTFSVAAGRTALITDAIAAAGRGDGVYPLGDRTVVVTGTKAVLEDDAPGETLAGSVLSMDAAVRNVVDLGIDRIDAIAAATEVPAQLAGRAELGTLRPGTPADVVVLDDDLRVRRTVVAGEVVA